MSFARSAGLLSLWTLHACGAGPDSGAQEVAAAPALQSFVETIPGTDVSFSMVAIPGGTFRMGSPAAEAGRADDEGPAHEVAISPFWIGAHEVTWEEYEQWMFSLEKMRRQGEPTAADTAADAITRPTPPYTDMTFGMGRDGYPAICMTQLAARTYCEWLSAKTGRNYRLPTEAEWEYACRAGTTTAYSFGDDPARIGEFAWFSRNSDDQYQPVGQQPANPWGLHDMHGNVAEWVQDALTPYAPSPDGAPLVDPVVEPTQLYPRVVRGGSWQDPPKALRSAARMGSDPDWKMQDPQIPQSVWYHTDATFVGFRVVRAP
ncbi:MAG: formylglycine-generating enzyme family protein [Planctomycetes bacterium]|nr:formylglycine-generating enzyme family protein [Planctomycetota bacterium]